MCICFKRNACVKQFSDNEMGREIKANKTIQLDPPKKTLPRKNGMVGNKQYSSDEI